MIGYFNFDFVSISNLLKEWLPMDPMHALHIVKQ